MQIGTTRYFLPEYFVAPLGGADILNRLKYGFYGTVQCHI